MTNLQWNREPLLRWSRWWLFCGWRTCSPPSGWRAAAHVRCLWTLYSHAIGRHHFWDRGDTGQAYPQSHTPGWDPGRLSGHWSAPSCWLLRQNCRPRILSRKQGRIWKQGCSCRGRLASGGRPEESVCRKRDSWGYGENIWVKTLSWLVLSLDTDRDGDTWLNVLTALITVHPVAEGADAGREGREGEIVVVPLPEQGNHVSEFSVVNHVFVPCA